LETKKKERPKVIQLDVKGVSKELTRVGVKKKRGKGQKERKQ